VNIKKQIRLSFFPGSGAEMLSLVLERLLPWRRRGICNDYLLLPLHPGWLQFAKESRRVVISGSSKAGTTTIIPVFLSGASWMILGKSACFSSQAEANPCDYFFFSVWYLAFRRQRPAG
jgi:hypothetical protein